jgi:integrase
MRSLEWCDVDLRTRTIRLRPENSKNKRGRVLKLGGGELLAIFQRAHERRRLDCLRVFQNDGQSIGDFRKAWKRACRTACLGKVLVHDLRRSGVRNSVRAGVGERVAMGVSGHKSRTVFDRYDIVAEADLEAAADRIDA